MRPSIAEQLTDFAITQEVAKDLREMRKEMAAETANMIEEIARLRAQLAALQAVVKAALHLDSLMSEFDGDETAVGIEAFEALWDACTAYRAALNTKEESKS